MIEVENVTKYYGSFQAVDDLNFTISKGEIVGLLGPNGAGKSTTMRMVTGFLKPSAGSIRIDGTEIAADPKSVKRKIGYLPESAPLYGDMMVEDYLLYVAGVQGVPAAKVPAAAASCGLLSVMHKNVNELSRGYRQRVGLAHALLHDPQILILDEPTSGLDPNQIIEVRSLIKEIGRTKTVVISTHILSEVEMLCDRVIIVSNGKIVADSPTAELRGRYGQSSQLKVQIRGCGFDEFAQAARALPGVSACAPEQTEDGLLGAVLSVAADADVRPAVFTLAVDRGWTLYEMTLRRNSLEDVFRSLTVGGDDK